MRYPRQTCIHGISPLRNCKECRRIYLREHREKINQRERDYYAKHQEEISKDQKEWRTKNQGKRISERVIEFGMRRGRNDFPLAIKCELCPVDEEKTERLEHHHPDYSYPEIYITACRECHNNANLSTIEVN
jgi:hypothetical protein